MFKLPSTLYSGTVKVRNCGLGPHADQTAEMVRNPHFTAQLKVINKQDGVNALVMLQKVLQSMRALLFVIKRNIYTSP